MSNPPLSKAEILTASADTKAARLFSLAKYGDQRAERDLHRLLADRLRAGAITEKLRAILAEIHDNAANGLPLIAAPPSNRAPDLRRRAEIYGEVSMHCSARDYVEQHRARMEAEHGRKFPKRPTMRAIYTAVAEHFNLSPQTVKNLYLAERAELGE